MSLSLVAKLTNFIELCQEYDISTQEYNRLIEEGGLEVTDVSITLTECKKFRNWDDIENQLKATLRQKIKMKEKADSLLAVLGHLDSLVSSIAKSIIGETRKRYDEQGWLGRLFSGDIQEDIRYYEAFKTVQQRGVAEYLEVNVAGSITFNKYLFAADEVVLTVSMKFRAVTLLLNIVASILEFRVTGAELLKKLEWYGNGIRSLN